MTKGEKTICSSDTKEQHTDLHLSQSKTGTIVFALGQCGTTRNKEAEKMNKLKGLQETVREG